MDQPREKDPVDGTVDGARIRIFVVEDDVDFAYVLADAIDHESDLAAVGVSHQVADTLELMGSIGPDVAVVDFHLPDGDGLALSRRIKDEHPSIAVVMLTGDDDSRMGFAAMEYGIDGFALKLSPLESVFNTIRLAHHGVKVYDADHLIQHTAAGLERLDAGNRLPPSLRAPTTT